MYVWVKDREGNEFLCPLDELIDPRKATEDQLDNAIDHGTAALEPRQPTGCQRGRLKRPS